MNIKDYLRILRRRWVWALFAAAIVFGALYYSTAFEPVHYTAHAKVLIEAPDPIQLAKTQGNRLLPHPITVATWQELITDRGVRNLVPTHLKKFVDDNTKIKKILEEGWIARVKVSGRESTYLTTISASSFDGDSAIALANAYVEAAVEYSQKAANTDLEQSLANAEKIIDEKEEHIRQLEAILEATEAVEGLEGGETLPERDARLHKLITAATNRINEIDRLLKQNNRAIEKLGEDRALYRTLSSESIPREDLLGKMRALENARVQKMEDDIKDLERKIMTSRKRYTPEHPEMRHMRDDLLDLREELTHLRVSEVRNDLDREEYVLLTENRIMEIERRVLKDDKARLTRERDSIAQPLAEYVRIDESIQREKANRDEMATVLTRMKGVGEVKGYVRRLEGQMAAGAAPAPGRGKQFLFLSALIAVLVGVALAYLMEQLDTKLRTDYEVKRHLNLSVLTVIPKVRAAPERLLVSSARGTLLSENFDTLITMLAGLVGEGPLRTLTIVSPNPKEGKSSVTINTAVAAARQGKRVLLVDADMRVASIHHMLGLSNEIGFSNLLGGDLTDEQSEYLYQDIGIENLRVITSGPQTDNPYALLESGNLKTVIEQLQQHFDMIIFDTPPILRTGDAVKLSGMTDGTLMVIGAAETDHRQALWAKHLLENVNSKILGVVLNKAADIGEKYYYYYYSGYGYGTGKRKPLKSIRS
ncbi:MAG: polysaccharide biosynthesis tyrosine autokinase [Planctomycetota bacterium]|jgi:capsular exopolysaccharide synthesis family protein